MREGFVYVFLRADGIRKLGWTINVHQRRSNCSTATGIRHEIEAFWRTDEATAQSVEGACHYALKAHRYATSYGKTLELYDLPLEPLVDAVDQAFDRLGALAHERTMAGLAAARERGRGGGRKSQFTLAQLEEAAELGTKPGARKLGMTPSGFLKALERERARAVDRTTLVSDEGR